MKSLLYGKIIFLDTIMHDNKRANTTDQSKESLCASMLYKGFFDNQMETNVFHILGHRHIANSEDGKLTEYQT